MPVNNTLANATAATQNFTQTIDAVPGLISKLNLGQVEGIPAVQKQGVLLQATIDGIDIPILKDLCLDVLGMLKGWFENPATLCCIVQGIWASYLSAANPKQTTFTVMDIKWGNNQSFRQYLDLLITFVDLLLALLTSDLRKFSFFLSDFIEEIADAVMGALLLVTEQTLKTVRGSLINELIYYVDKLQTSANNGVPSIWAKCLPFAQFLNIIKKYISDYGMFAKLNDWIKSWLGKKISWKGFGGALDLAPNVKDLEFLYWFRDFLVKLKQALINFDLCVGYDFMPGLANAPTPGITPTGQPNPLDVTKYGGTANPVKGLGIKVASNGSILVDSNITSTAGSLPLLTNAQLKPFLVKYMGYPSDVVDNLIAGTTSADHIQGSNINSQNFSNAAADCPNSPAPADVIKWVLSIRKA